MGCIQEHDFQLCNKADVNAVYQSVRACLPSILSVIKIDTENWEQLSSSRTDSINGQKRDSRKASICQPIKLYKALVTENKNMNHLQKKVNDQNKSNICKAATDCYSKTFEIVNRQDFRRL